MTWGADPGEEVTLQESADRRADPGKESGYLGWGVGHDPGEESGDWGLVQG